MLLRICASFQKTTEPSWIGNGYVKKFPFKDLKKFKTIPKEQVLCKTTETPTIYGHKLTPISSFYLLVFFIISAAILLNSAADIYCIFSKIDLLLTLSLIV
jgi:hypothetical protein